MIIIKGTLKEHIRLNNWAFLYHNEMLEYIPKINHEVYETTVYPIIMIPEGGDDG